MMQDWVYQEKFDNVDKLKQWIVKMEYDETDTDR